MSTPTVDLAIVGAGAVGLGTALQFQRRFPHLKIAVLEKEAEVACHQTGNNSGVIHSGLYYRPGSHKARMSVAGVEALHRFCDEHQVPYETCGKVVVATDDREIPALDELHSRGQANGVPDITVLDPDQLREYEPHVTGVKALHVPTTGIIDFKQVAQAYARVLQDNGGQVLVNHRVLNVITRSDELVVNTAAGSVTCKYLVNCAGLQCDRVARLCGSFPKLKIVPFRGEYYKLRPDRYELVRNLIYPVPDPRFPFLGVHFTRMIEGGIEAGPNAVLALKREGYHKTDLNLVDSFETLTYPGFWRMAAKFWQTGFGEMYRSFYKPGFVKALQKLIPSIQSTDLEPGGSGIRAQAMGWDGKLLDDFCFETSPRAIHVLNAPSPAATASLVIGESIVQQAVETFRIS